MMLGEVPSRCMQSACSATTSQFTIVNLSMLIGVFQLAVARAPFCFFTQVHELCVHAQRGTKGA